MSNTDYSTAATDTLLAVARALPGIYPQWVTNLVVEELAARGITYNYRWQEWEFRYGCGMTA